MRECRVYYRDHHGIEHSVRVNAVNRYDAFGRALAQLRRCPCANPDHADLVKMGIEVLGDKGRVVGRYTVTREEFDTWLGPSPPRIDDPFHKLRSYLLMLLGRMEPDRDFKRGLRAR